MFGLAVMLSFATQTTSKSIDKMPRYVSIHRKFYDALCISMYYLFLTFSSPTASSKPKLGGSIKGFF